MDYNFYRIAKLPPYVFAEVNAIKHKLRVEGKDVIDFGMGNPDSPTPKHIVDKLVEAVGNPHTHRYSSSKGIPGLRKAASKYYERRFNVNIDMENEVVVTIGSKEGLASLAKAITKPGDTILVPNPGYPIHTWGFVFAEAIPHFIIKDDPNSDKSVALKQIKKLLDTVKPKPVALIVNYPCNPTAEVADLAYYEEIVSICKHHKIFAISDLAYCEIYFDENNPPPSILQVKGAKDLAIEFTTMSKTYSMPGWRVGFAVGNKHLVGAVAKIKSYLDYGTFTPIQVAAAAALNGPQKCVSDVRKLYKERRDILIEGLASAGWNVPAPSASMFVWAKIPDKYLKKGSLKFSKDLLMNCDVAVAPGIGFGEHGDGYVRFALVENKQRIRQATRNIKIFLKK